MGLYGVFSESLAADKLRATVVAMLATLPKSEPHGGVDLPPCGAVALTGQVYSSNASTASGFSGERVFLSRTCFNLPELAVRYKVPRDGMGTDTQAGLVAALVGARGPAVVGELNGVFACVCHHGPSGRILIANDRYGYHPLYYHERGGLLIISSDCRAILAVAEGLSPDMGGWGDVFYTGSMIGNRTLYREIRAVGPGEYLLWGCGRTDLKRYWEMRSVPVRPGDEVSPEEVNERFSRAVGLRLEQGRPDTLLLSAGLDSRLILGAMLALGHRPSLLTVAFEKRRDLAPQLARSLGLECEVRAERTGAAGFADSVEVFRLLEGLRQVFRMSFPGLKVFPWIEPRMVRVWDGLALDAALGGGNQFEGSLRRNLWRYLGLRSRHRPFLRDFLRPDLFEQVETEFHAGLNEELERVEDSEDGSLRFLLANQNRRRIGVIPHQLYSSKVLALTPGSDPDFLDFLLSVPFRVRRNHRLYLSLLARCHPDLLATPFIHEGRVIHCRPEHGGPSEIPPVRERLAELLRRFGCGPAAGAVLTRFRGGWEVARDFMCRTVRLQGLERGFYNRRQVEKILNGAESGALRWLVPLSLLFTIELWHQAGTVVQSAPDP